MRKMIVIAALACLFSNQLIAQDDVSEDNLSTVAIVDQNRIQNEIGYQRFIFLEMSDEVRAEVQKLKTSLDQIVADSLVEENEDEVAFLQQKIQLINNKLNLLRNAMGNRGHDNRRSLAKYISGKYAEKYALIIDANVLRGGGNVLLIDNKKVTDLTDEIIETLDKELP